MTSPGSLARKCSFLQRIAQSSTFASRASLLFFAVTALVSGPGYACGILQVRDGYFWDPVLREYFIPRGFAYQTFNPPVGADQTPEQLAYDLTEFKKLLANSARVEMVWNQIEVAPGVFEWTKADYLVNQADQLGLRLFVLVGFQYAPGWFPPEWTATNDSDEGSVVVNYEHPRAREAYSNYVFRVAQRYKDRTAVAAWILGNEYAYFDLWNTNRHFLGYDPISQQSFKTYLTALYSTNITLLNSNWGTAASDFTELSMPRLYPRDRNDPAYFDLIQWRKKSIGDYVAVGALAARKADPNHLLTYSMVGGVFSGFDELNTCEDAKTIVNRCKAAGAPLSFWSVNNYALASLGSELRAADYGIAKYQAQSGLPVLVTETGHSSTDDLNPEEPQRYARALPTQLWEALISGALGVHVFTWNDRHLFAGAFIRERGFGIVEQNRMPKQPVFDNVANAFRRMENLNLPVLLGASKSPVPDILYFWSQNADLVWPRANLENALTWGAFKRLGFAPGFLDDEQFESGAATNAKALFLSRCWMMSPAHLERIATNLIPAGIHVHANADLPGEYTPYHAPNPRWQTEMNSLFGLNTERATPGLDSGITNVTYGTLFFQGVTALGPFSAGYSDQVMSWKLWHGIPTNSGTVVFHTGRDGTQNPVPALQVKNLGTAKTAANTFGLGDLENSNPAHSLQHKWDFRYTWLKAIYRDYFGLTPQLDASGVGAAHVFLDYRLCSNGSVLIGLLNGDTNIASIVLTAKGLLAAKTVENLTSGTILETNSDGVVNLTMQGDEYVLLYAYGQNGSVDASLINPIPNKLWIVEAPAAVWPTGSNCVFTVGYDTVDPNLRVRGSFERSFSPDIVFSLSDTLPISGTGQVALSLKIPDADPNNPWYLSSMQKGEYVFHACLMQNDVPIADTYLPVRVLWPVKPLSLPQTVIPGTTYQVTIQWEELPSWIASENGNPLDRAALWQPYLASQQYYNLVLELRSGGTVLASESFLTNRGTGQHTFAVRIPPNSSGPFTWTAYLEAVTNVSNDMTDSFEDRDTGEGNLYEPWTMLTYPEGVNIWQNAGVTPSTASDGKQAVFMVLTNPPNPQGFAGCFLFYTYPQTWALPHDISQWTNYVFGFDFSEANGRSCVLELQVKDNRGGLINFTKPYSTNAGWDRIQASLDRFTGPSWMGHFDPDHVSQLVLNIQLLETNEQYLGYLDNVQFIGPKTAVRTTAPEEIWDSFDDRGPGTGADQVINPWLTYVYPPPSSRELDRGIVLNEGLNGGQAAMVVATNPPGIGPVSTFGIYRGFTNTWALPANTNAWTNYVLSYSFREANWRSCRVEMQIKSGLNNWIEFGQTYKPDSGGWHRLRASLADFIQPTNIALFDPKHVEGIALNIRVFETGATYVGFFDDVFFDTPDLALPSGTRFGIYTSENDSRLESITLAIDTIQRESDGTVTLSWLARSNRLYTVEYQDSPFISQDCFQPLPGIAGFSRTTDGILSAADTNAPVAASRFYRLRMQPQ